MTEPRIEQKWIDAFRRVLEMCALRAGDVVAILSETQSRQVNVQLAELAARASAVKQLAVAEMRIKLEQASALFLRVLAEAKFQPTKTEWGRCGTNGISPRRYVSSQCAQNLFR